MATQSVDAAALFAQLMAAQLDKDSTERSTTKKRFDEIALWGIYNAINQNHSINGATTQKQLGIDPAQVNVPNLMEKLPLGSSVNITSNNFSMPTATEDKTPATAVQATQTPVPQVISPTTQVTYPTPVEQTAMAKVLKTLALLAGAGAAGIGGMAGYDYLTRDKPEKPAVAVAQPTSPEEMQKLFEKFLIGEWEFYPDANSTDNGAGRDTADDGRSVDTSNDGAQRVDIEEPTRN